MTEGINGSALGYTYNNPAFYLNSIDSIRGRRLEHNSQNKHFSMGQMPPKKHRLNSGHDADVDSLGSNLDDWEMEQVQPMGQRNVDLRNDAQDYHLFQAGSDPKRVSFTLASGNL
uniref:Uncharacterized protein n=1 Tax=Plectus sambesii TaxID=2011161 RepID=A0A914UTE2_9BILA